MATTNQVAQYNTLIITTAMKQGIPQVIAKLMASQAAWETGNFTSNNFLTNNNAFGMAVPSVRKSPYILGAGSVNAPKGEGGFAYAKYASIEDSVKDLIHWLNYNHVDWSAIDTPEKYDTFLTSKGYHGDSHAKYTAGITMYYNRIKDIIYKNPKTSIVLLLSAVAMIATGAYLYYKRKKLA